MPVAIRATGLTYNIKVSDYEYNFRRYLFQAGYRYSSGGIAIDFSGIVCVDAGQVIAFFHPAVTGEGIENFFSNCFLVVGKRSQPDVIRQLLTEVMSRAFCPVFSLSSRDVWVFTLLAEGKSYAFISSVCSLSFGATCYIRNKILSRYGVRNLNIFLVVMHHLRNGLVGKACPVLQCAPPSAWPASGGLHA
ncbi:UNVERIFIED_ORG: hypothetical protein FHU01_4482 [Citrobacter freundii]